MSGLQSFVVQRQQGHPDQSRQALGPQHRVPVPITKLENTKKTTSIQRPSTNLPAIVARSKTHLCRQQLTDASAVQGGFDTDAEGFDDTTTMSIRGSSPYHQEEGDDREPDSSLPVVGTANNLHFGAQVFLRRGEEQPYHAEGSRQQDAEGSADDNEVSYEESSDEDADEESDEEELVHDGILHDLNSPGFSQYLQGRTSLSNQAAFQPHKASTEVRGSPALRDLGQHSQKLEEKFTSRGIRDGGAANPSVNLQHANRQTHECATQQVSAMPAQSIRDLSTEQLSISAQLAAQYRRLSDHHEPSQQPSVTCHQTLLSMSRAGMGVAQDVVATNVQPQPNEESPSSVPNGSIDLSDKSSASWDPNIINTQDTKHTASVDGLQTRKRAKDLDYSPEQLSSMTFQQLSNEPFNLPSERARAFIVQELSSDTLAAKMDNILQKSKDDGAKVVHRRAFFSSLSVEQYDECANLIIRRFSGIVSTFADARQQRRRAAKDFEEEVAKREECVRGKTSVVDKDLGRLRRGGEEVVRGAAL